MAFATTFSRHKNPNHQKVLSINTAVQGTQGTSGGGPAPPPGNEAKAAQKEVGVSETTTQ